MKKSIVDWESLREAERKERLIAIAGAKANLLAANRLLHVRATNDSLAIAETHLRLAIEAVRMAKAMLCKVG